MVTVRKRRADVGLALNVNVKLIQQLKTLDFSCGWTLGQIAVGVLSYIPEVKKLISYI